MLCKKAFIIIIEDLSNRDVGHQFEIKRIICTILL